MRRPIAIFGAGGMGREVLQVVRDVNTAEPGTWNPIGFILDREYNSLPVVKGLPVLGGIEWLQRNPDVLVCIAVGPSASRYRIAMRIVGESGNRFATLVHPRAWIGNDVAVGHGSVICAGALVNTDIHIGEHVHINTGSTIGHDTVLNDFVTLYQGVNVSGNVTLRQGAEIGAGTVLIPQTEVGSWAIVGAGATVIRSLGDNVTAVGSPAKVIKVRTAGWHEA